MLLHLIRHGETDWNVSRRVMGRSDVPLNDIGRMQAERLAEAMAVVSLDEILTSPQLRARQTAEPLVRRLGVPLSVEEGLAEVDFPKWVGMDWNDLQKDPFYQLYREEPATARADEVFEAMADVFRRTTGVLRRLEERNPNGSYALISHADPLRTIFSYVSGQPLAEFRRWMVSNAAVSIVEGSSERWGIKLFNYQPGDRWFDPEHR